MSHEEPGDAGMKCRHRGRTIERRWIVEKPLRDASRLERRQGRQHGPVPTLLQTRQHLAPGLAGRTNGFDVKTGHLVDVLVGDHETERDDRPAQGLGIEIGREGDHRNDRPDPRVGVPLWRVVGEPQPNDELRRPGLDRVESIAPPHGDEADAGGEVLVDVQETVITEATRGPLAARE